MKILFLRLHYAAVHFFISTLRVSPHPHSVFFFSRETQKSAREPCGKSASEPVEFARELFRKTCPGTWKSARGRELSVRESSKCP